MSHLPLAPTLTLGYRGVPRRPLNGSLGQALAGWFVRQGPRCRLALGRPGHLLVVYP